MYKVLHVTPDDKFFDVVFSIWEKMDGLLNEAILIVDNEHYTLRYIKNAQKLQIAYDENEIRCRLAQDDYQILYFHSLSPEIYKYIRFVPKNKVIIWWAWGFDVYYENISPKPFIDLTLLKPITRSFQPNPTWISQIYTTLRLLIKDLLVKKRQKKVLNRIDYFQPVTKIEYALMQKNRGFRAKEFYHEDSLLDIEIKMTLRSSKGNILIGNSATITNNHVDVLNHVVKSRDQQQQIIMPLNYGGDSNYLTWLLNNIQKVDNITPLLEFMPANEYYDIVESCSYACFGVIRQQAMGNIRYALSRGIKVFLYKDSIPYKSLKNMGFAVYAIEDMDAEALQTPLTPEENEQNILAFNKEITRRSCLCKQFFDDMKNNQINKY